MVALLCSEPCRGGFSKGRFMEVSRPHLPQPQKVILVLSPFKTLTDTAVRALQNFPQALQQRKVFSINPSLQH